MWRWTAARRESVGVALNSRARAFGGRRCVLRDFFASANRVGSCAVRNSRRCARATRCGAKIYAARRAPRDQALRPAARGGLVAFSALKTRRRPSHDVFRPGRHVDDSSEKKVIRKQRSRGTLSASRQSAADARRTSATTAVAAPQRARTNTAGAQIVRGPARVVPAPVPPAQPQQPRAKSSAPPQHGHPPVFQANARSGRRTKIDGHRQSRGRAH